MVIIQDCRSSGDSQHENWSFDVFLCDKEIVTPLEVFSSLKK
jgi:hypothetical protein